MRIGLICGGPSEERGISLNSARSAMTHLISLGWEVISFYCDLNCDFYLLSSAQLYSNTPSDFDFKLTTMAQPLSKNEFVDACRRVDIIFPVIHGEYGEDGKLQELLEEHHIPFVGSSSKSCHRMFDKLRANREVKKMENREFSTLPYCCIKESDSLEIRLQKATDFFVSRDLIKVVVKPSAGGSSLGVETATTPLEAVTHANNIFTNKLGSQALIEPYIEGREFTVTVLQSKNDKPVALIPTEIDLKGSEIYTFRQKYLPSNEVEFHCPPRFKDEEIKKIQKFAESIFEYFGMRDFSRLDGRISNDNHIIFTDFNPITYLEQNSDIFLQGSSIGLSHSDILRYIVTHAAKRYGIKCTINPVTKNQNAQKIRILFGGETSERQVSVMSGTNVWLQLLYGTDYLPSPYILGPENKVWQVPYHFMLNSTSEEILENCANAEAISLRLQALSLPLCERLDIPLLNNSALIQPQSMNLDQFCKEAVEENAFVFIALHGGKGENGWLQDKLNQHDLAYNGSDVKASSLCMDKYETGNVLRLEFDLRDPVLISKEKILINVQQAEKPEIIWTNATRNLNTTDIIIKPQADGSSTGVARLKSKDDLKNYLRAIKQCLPVLSAKMLTDQSFKVNLPLHTDNFILEPYIETDKTYVSGLDLDHKLKSGWIELTVGVLEDNGEYHALSPSITIAKENILSLEEKFQGGTGVNLTPPPMYIITDEQIVLIKTKIQQVAKALGIQGYARIDIFFNKIYNKIIVIEANTLPGLTPSTVIYHQALAEEPPLNPQDFLSQLIESGIKRWTKVQAYQKSKPIHNRVNFFIRELDKQQAWDNLVKQTYSKDKNQSYIAVSALCFVFSEVPDKQQAWNDLIKLTNNQNKNVRNRAIKSLGVVFSQVPDKQKAWNDLIKLTNDKSKSGRNSIASVFYRIFSEIPDKQQKCNDLHKQVSDKNSVERYMAASAISIVFSEVPDKQQAWNDLIILTQDKDRDVRNRAVKSLGVVFSEVPDKIQAWNDLIKLTNDENSNVRKIAASFLNSIYSNVPDKQKAWDDLIKLTSNEDSNVRNIVVSVLSSIYSQVPDKQQALNNLHQRAYDENSIERYRASCVIGFIYSQVSDRQQVWNDLQILINDTNSKVRNKAANALIYIFPEIPDKQQAWNDLIKLTHDNDTNIRNRAANAFVNAFSEVPDKQQAWNDLIKLISEIDKDMRNKTAEVLVSVFSKVPNKQQAWDNLIKLISEEEKDVRNKVIETLDSVFSKVPNKQQAWNNLILLMKNDDNILSSKAVDVLVSVFSKVSDKQQAWNDLIKLTGDKRKNVRHSAAAVLVSVSANMLNQKQAWNDLIKLTSDKDQKMNNLIVDALAYFIYEDLKQNNLLDYIQEKAKSEYVQTIGTPDELVELGANKSAKELLQYNNALNEQIEDLKKFSDFILPDKKNQFYELIEETKNIDVINEIDSHKKFGKMKEINDFILGNPLHTHIKEIHFENRIKDKVRIATVQLNFLLSNTFPILLRDEYKEKVKEKILNAVKEAEKLQVNILCLPELCLCENWLSDIKALCSDMIIVPGTYYDKNDHNKCNIIYSKYEVPPQYKICCSKFEDPTYFGTGMVKGELLNVYQSRYGNFTVLICRDFGNYAYIVKGRTDFIICPSYNKATETFFEIAHELVKNYPLYIIISNTAVYGGTSIFGQFDKSLFPSLVSKDYKKLGDETYKLCQIEKNHEGMIYADFDLRDKRPHIQSYIDPQYDISPISNIHRVIWS